MPHDPLYSTLREHNRAQLGKAERIAQMSDLAPACQAAIDAFALPGGAPRDSEAWQQLRQWQTELSYGYTLAAQVDESWALSAFAQQDALYLLYQRHYHYADPWWDDLHRLRRSLPERFVLSAWQRLIDWAALSPVQQSELQQALEGLDYRHLDSVSSDSNNDNDNDNDNDHGAWGRYHFLNQNGAPQRAYFAPNPAYTIETEALRNLDVDATTQHVLRRVYSQIERCEPRWTRRDGVVFDQHWGALLKLAEGATEETAEDIEEWDEQAQAAPEDTVPTLLASWQYDNISTHGAMLINRPNNAAVPQLWPGDILHIAGQGWAWLRWMRSRSGSWAMGVEWVDATVSITHGDTGPALCIGEAVLIFDGPEHWSTPEQGYQRLPTRCGRYAQYRPIYRPISGADLQP